MSSVLVMGRKLFKLTFPGVSVEASGVMLRSYSGHLSQVQGQAKVVLVSATRKQSFPFTQPRGHHRRGWAKTGLTHWVFVCRSTRKLPCMW